MKGSKSDPVRGEATSATVAKPTGLFFDITYKDFLYTNCEVIDRTDVLAGGQQGAVLINDPQDGWTKVWFKIPRRWVY